MTVEEDIRAMQEERAAGPKSGVTMGKQVLDAQIYGSLNMAGYAREVVDEEDDEAPVPSREEKSQHRIELAADEKEVDPFEEHRKSSGRLKIAERETEYQAKRLDRGVSPERGDAFAGKTPARSYKDIMQSQNMAKERDDVLKQIADDEKKDNAANANANANANAAAAKKKRHRWDDAANNNNTNNKALPPPAGRFDSSPGRFAETPGRFDATPGRFDATPGRFDATPGRFDSTPGRFDATPGRFDATPGRFDSTPGRFDGAAQSRFDATPGRFDATPGRAFGDATPSRFGATPGRFDATPGRFDATPGRFDATPGRFDATPGRFDATPGRFAATPGRFEATPGRFEATPGRFDQTPGRFDATPARFSDTPARGKVSKWEETPGREAALASSGRWDETPLAPEAAAVGSKRSRWDETPLADRQAEDPGTPAGIQGATPTPSSFLPGGSSAATPFGGLGPNSAVTPEMAQRLRWEREMHERNRYLGDDELDALFPATGYRILEPPAGYAPIHTPSRKLAATPTPLNGADGGFSIAATPLGGSGGSSSKIDAVGGVVPAHAEEADLPSIKPEDYQYFSKLVEDVDEDKLSNDDARELKIMRLLLKIKNGTPPQRKQAMRQMTDKAREFGAASLFNQILPLLMSPTLEDQERHLLVKVIDRILYKLDDLVRPFVHKILVVIEPLLIDEDYYARVEGREIISNLAKAAGLATMIATMRPDIDNMDEYVRNTTARAFAVVASALGIPALLPFLKAVCQSRKSWQARHTGVKIVQQIAILMGCAVLPHLRQMVDIIEHGLVDDQQKVRTISSLALAALAEAAYPYGIESFDSVLKPLWKGIRHHRGKGLAAFLKAIGFIIPLMDANYANYYTREVMIIVIREFQSPDEEMKKIVLKVVKQAVATDGVETDYVRGEILPEFFRNFWVRRMALDRRNYKQVVETTVELANKVGAAEVIGRICDDLKDESEPYRRMVMETIEHVIQEQGTDEIDARLEEQLIDGVLYAFQEQASDDTEAMLSGFGVVVNALGIRTKPYLPQIAGTTKWRLNNKSASVRMQAADLVARIAVVMKTCQEEQLMGHLGVVLYEYLGEEYPEVLGSILGALKAIVNVIGMQKMTPPIKDLLPRLTPILKNRHEKVQENCIAEGTMISMADGTAQPIESVRVGDRVLSPRVADDVVLADVAKTCTRVVDNGERDCVQITLEDGRTLVCTGDHRILTSRGVWKTASKLQLDERVAVASRESPAAPRPSSSSSDRRWTLRLAELTLSLETEADLKRTLAFSRLVGYLLGGAGCLDTKPNDGAAFAVGCRADVDLIAADIELLGDTPRIVWPRRTDAAVAVDDAEVLENLLESQVAFRVVTHVSLRDALASVPGMMAGQEMRLPDFVTDEDTPVCVVRECLAGLFGGGGKTVCLSKEEDDRAAAFRHVELVRSCRPLEPNAKAELAYVNGVKGALGRCGVAVEDASVAQTFSDTPRTSLASTGAVSSSQRTTTTMTTTTTTTTRLTLSDSLSFAEQVGFRYCAQKETRLAAACVYFRSIAKTTKDQQRRKGVVLRDRSNIEESSKATLTTRSPTREKEKAGPGPGPGPTTTTKGVLFAGSRGARSVMTSIGCGDWFETTTTTTTCSVSAASTTPTLSLKVVEVEEVGSRRVYDLTVPGNEAFFANSMAAHNCIDLVGRIADRGAEFVSAREWMRICFELLEMLKAHKKAIRRAAVNTFGYIAKAIGPQDVLHTLLNNLKVQERQNRVCTTVAIGIVAETCAPFTVLPALMNEYRVPELNVQNGVLKAASFLFEYIGEMGKDYVYAVTPLLEDALMDRDLVHRQTACAAIKHIALGVAGLGCEDALVHLLNFVWPNVFETSPHVIAAVFEAIEAFIVALGVPLLLTYVLPGLYHPARRIRDVYWKIYNSLYIYGADALTSCYPTLENEGLNTYRRTQLEIFL